VYGNTNTKPKDDKVSIPKIYNDPSLFRTANIQPITPACIDIPLDNLKKTEIKNAVKIEFPNEDIEKDFERSLRIKENKNKNETQNQVLDYIQIRKDKRHFNNQSKESLTSNTTSNQKFSNRWQFAAESFNGQNNDTDKRHKNEYNHHNNIDVVSNNDKPHVIYTNENINKNKKVVTENVTWNRNMFNNRHSSKDNNINNGMNENNNRAKSVSPVQIISIQQNNNSHRSSTIYTKENNSSKSSLFDNDYTRFFHPLASKINSNDIECTENTSCTISNANSNINENNNYSISSLMSNELSQIKIMTSIPMTSYSMVSNPITCYSGVNPIGDSVATMISYRS